MPRLILHIGTHKTGTTSVQDRLHANREQLRRAGVIYPDLGRHSGHHGYLTDWIALPQAYAVPGGGRRALAELAETWRDTDATLLLSSEEFARAGGRGGTVDFAALCRIFARYEVHLVCVLRDQIGFLQSVYAEVSRNALPARPPVFLKTAYETGMVDGLWCDYGRLYAGLRRTFEPDQITLLDYASVRARPDGVLSAILGAVSPDLTAEMLTESPETWSNRSPAVLPLWAAQVVAGGSMPDAILQRAAEEAFAAEFGIDRPQCLFTRDEIDLLKAHFDAGNADFAQRLASDGIALAVTAPALAEDMLYRDDMSQDLWIRIARRLSFACRTVAA